MVIKAGNSCINMVGIGLLKDISLLLNVSFGEIVRTSSIMGMISETKRAFILTIWLSAHNV
jgi:hypothetical protein